MTIIVVTNRNRHNQQVYKKLDRKLSFKYRIINNGKKSVRKSQVKTLEQGKA